MCLGECILICESYDICVLTGMWGGIPLDIIAFHWQDRIGKICLVLDRWLLMSWSLEMDLWIILYVAQHVYWSTGMWKDIPLNIISFHWLDRIGKICLGVGQMAIDVLVTGNLSMDRIICCATFVLICWNVKGHSTQCNFFPLTG